MTDEFPAERTPKNFPFDDVIMGILGSRTRMSQYLHVKQQDVITYTCLDLNGVLDKTAVDVGTVMSNYIPHKAITVIVYPRPNLC